VADAYAWHKDVALFTKIVQENPGLWLVDPDLKYLNIRLDTRGGEFLVTCGDGEAVSADRVVKAARTARSKGYNRAYADVSEADANPKSTIGEIDGKSLSHL